MELMKANKPDLLAFNYYYSESISAFPLDEDHKIGDIEFKLLPSREAGIYQVVKNNNLKATLWGWEIDDIGLQCSARLLWERYHLPLLITENGFGNREQWPEEGILQDDDRIDYLSRHIHNVKEAMNLGVEFIGFCAWSFMDLISGHSGFSKRYGFVYVNRDEHDLKDLARRKKKSFYWYKDVIANNGKDL
ncbi:MAG: glycoside hydrolase family 1 protein [Erysipelotrichaceae bacterium]|nr:glycoside hydrolase family 1 protein [Erysipelotrichaceae bacterium]